MKLFSIALLLTSLLFGACQHSQGNIVQVEFADSLISNYSYSERIVATDRNRAFWQNRMDSLPENFVNGPKYASALSAYFQVFGDIHDLLKADSLMKRSNEANQEKEPGIFRSLASLAMTRHRFHEADSFLEKAIAIEGRSFSNLMIGFDIAFELGDHGRARKLLGSIKEGNTYGYLFRRAKYEHFDGSLDSAISCMLQAADKAGNYKSLQQAALSNAADLYIHKASLRKAYVLYVKSIKIDASDFHSILGMGWIALVHDKNDSLAEKIFLFVRQHSHAPDALLKLEQVGEAKEDSAMQRYYAHAFESQVSDSSYGAMYSKYLIDLYTGILNDPGKAVTLSLQETNNRPTAQAFAWYAWSLYCNKQTEKAYQVFKAYVSQQPLEGLELYYMGKMMQGMNKPFNAQQFFKAAKKNRYDLSPAKMKDLEKNLE